MSGTKNALPSREELRALLSVLQSLNHYQLLKISPAAQVSEIQSAFHREALFFHPDRYQSKGRKESIEEARQIYVKIVEAYNTLSHREKRIHYDQELQHPSHEASHPNPSFIRNQATTTAAKTKVVLGPGQKFFKLAQTALQSGNRASAKLNIQLALNMEPDNSEYKKFSDKLATLK